MYDIIWKLQQNSPYASEDCLFNILDNKIILSCGASRTTKGIKCKFDGFTTMGFVYDIEKKEWDNLPNFPGGARQGIRGVVVDSKLYAWGGYSYSPTRPEILKTMKRWPTKKNYRSYKDGYMLYYDNDSKKYIWEKLPELPDPLANFGIATKDKIVYVCSGGIADTKYGQLSVEINTCGSNLHSLNLNNFDDKEKFKWKKLKSLPGTPRYYFSCFIHTNYIYALGGLYPNNKWQYGDKTSRYISILDNWKYNINNDEWERLVDNPYPLTAWSSCGNITYDNKAILCGSAYRDESFLNRKLIKSNTLKTIVKKGSSLFQTCDIILMYDIINDTFTKCDFKLPFKINTLLYKVVDNIIYFITGEVEGCTSARNKKHKILDGIFYGPHLCLHMTGTLIKK